MKLFVLSLLICVSIFSFSQGKGYYPKAAADRGYYNAISLKPGDTVFVGAQYDWSYIYFENQHGTPDRPIVIMNRGGQALLRGNQLKFESCTDIKVLGTGDANFKYGFRIKVYEDNALQPQGVSIFIDGKSKNIEISNVDIRNSGTGVLIGKDARCDPSYNFPLWVIDNISIHDCQIKRMWNQGMYIGNTNPDNSPVASYGFVPRPVTCNGVVTYPRAARAGNITVYNNIIDSCGRSGIQLSAVSEGVNEIYNNVVKHCGMNNDEAQANGIVIGSYTKAYIHDNTIVNTLTHGIASISGAGTGTAIRIENNRIDSSGYLQPYNFGSASVINPNTQPVISNNRSWPYAIFLSSGTLLQTDSTMFWIKNNKIGLRKSTATNTNKGAAIGVFDQKNTFHKTGNIICGNVNFDGSSANTMNNEAQAIPVYYSGCEPDKIYYNSALSGSFTKNNCGADYTSQPITYTIQAKKYSSKISQADADGKANAEMNNNGQLYANENGVCVFIRKVVWDISVNGKRLILYNDGTWE